MEFITRIEWDKLSFKSQKEYFKSLKRSEREPFRHVINMSERYMYEQYFPDEFKLLLNTLQKEPEKLIKLEKYYKFNLRPNQFWPEKEFVYWLVQAGRGFGKTRVGAEWVRWLVNVKKQRYVNLCGATMTDAIDIMVHGESGIMNVCDDYDRPIFKNNKLYWKTGAISLIFSAEEPERARGKQHSQLWLDELGAWRYAEMFDQLMFGLRLGDMVQCCITTTPRTNDLMRRIIEDPNTIITRGSTFDNKNLNASYLNTVTKRFKGTKLGRQELYGEFLDKNENALFDPAFIDSARTIPLIQSIDKDGKEVWIPRPYTTIAIGVDPAVTSTEDSDETGIVVAAKGLDGEYYVLEDASFIAKPQDWAREVVRLYKKWNANIVIAERNQGGDLIEATIRNIDKNISYDSVWAKNSKRLRAEPVTLLYEQGLVHHVGKADEETDPFFTLERQMFNYTGDPKQKSPDRLDALVYVLTHLNDGNGWTELADQFEATGKTMISDVVEEQEALLQKQLTYNKTASDLFSSGGFDANDFFNN